MAYLTHDNLIDDDGELDDSVYRAMVRRRCMNEYGAITPRSLRNAVQHYRVIIPILMNRKREALGLPPVEIKMVPMMDTGWRPNGICREA